MTFVPTTENFATRISKGNIAQTLIAGAGFHLIAHSVSYQPYYSRLHTTN